MSFQNILSLFIILLALVSAKSKKSLEISLFTKSNQNSEANKKTIIKTLTQYNKVQYYGKMKFGSEEKEVVIQFDTGSAWTWIAGQKYPNADNKIQKQTEYSCKESKTCKPFDVTRKVAYGIGEISGNLGLDDIYLTDSIKVEQQAMIEVTEAKFYPKIHYSGMIGLSFNKLSNSIPTFLDNLHSQGHISTKSFSLRIQEKEAGSSSSIEFGGYNKDYMGEENFNELDVVDEEFWMFKFEAIEFSLKDISVTYGSKSDDEKLESISVLPDIGSTGISFQTKDFWKIFETIRKFNPKCAYSRVHGMINCFGRDSLEKLPNLTFVFNSKKYIFTPEDYSLKIGGYFYLWLKHFEHPKKMIALGDVFMKRYYFNFDAERRIVGMSKKKAE